jgi:TRAP-type C4-dicarboxylate transport system substrate-binding protein
MIFMERKRYAALPAAVRKVLDDNTGEAVSRALGAFTDRDGAANRDRVKAMAGQAVVTPTPAQYKEMEAKLAPITEQWVKDTPNGAAILAAWKKNFADAKAGR